ncbi:MAG TPA: nitroreductase family protein [Candidatus Limivivens merdigallinarum]|uniref:Nitroreductase family protein n=1 Tax=Candidatus Limivivens merdigallinarum TaxID=2840859 RepID=A0A9D0ZT91_9FIRM|nr:nitroreductase family protein [Candidatus Limivivens merdigallinarum]
MNLYEAIYSRRSVRSYRMEPIEQQTLDGIPEFLKELEPLFPDIRTEIKILDNCTGRARIGGFCNVRAPYYAALYTEEKEKCEMNGGYLMQQLALHLESRGLGSCFVGMAKKRDKELESQGMHFLILLAFGIPKNPHRSTDGEVKRYSLEELCIFKEPPKAWVKEILEAARLAPSSLNSQPWRFVVYENRIHVFSKKPLHDKKLLNRFQEMNFGIMLANVMVAAEEVWVDLDLIKLNNITHKTIPNNQYVISILLKP